MEEICLYLFKCFTEHSTGTESFRRYTPEGKIHEEIDGILYLNTKKGVLNSFQNDIFLEAKNHNKKIDKNDISLFLNKISKRNLKFGLIFSYSGFKSTCFHERNDCLMKNGVHILFFELKDIESISNGIWPTMILAKKYEDCIKM